MRLDLDNKETRIILKREGINVELAIRLNSPIDVCKECYRYSELDDEVDHPPYNDGVEYYCALCDELLTGDDD